MKQKLTELEGPTIFPDIFITVLVSILVFAVAYVAINFFNLGDPRIPFGICLLFLTVFLAGSKWCESLKKGDSQGDRNFFVKWYADFGKRLWHFPGLWYVVFLIGCYLAAISLLANYSEQAAKGNIAGLILQLFQNIIIAVFLAVLTLVLAHTFSHVGDLTEDVKSVISDSEDSSRTISATAEYVRAMGNDMRLLSTTLLIASHSGKTSERIYKIMEAARQLEGQDGKKAAMTNAITTMCSEVVKYHTLALNPLLPPGILPPADGDVNDPFIDIANKLHGEEEAPRYAYMAAAIGRYFNGEALERQFPGVLLHVTSFAYYIRTIESIVSALSPWRDRFEFYTLMPRSPISLFRFSNSQDIKEWRAFLLSYCKFQTDKCGIWKRYFAYTTTPTNPYEFSTLEDMRYFVRNGYVVVEKGSWLPRIIRSDEIDKLFGGVGSTIQGRFMLENPFHGGVGTLAGTYDGVFNDSDWQKINKVLLGYHGLPTTATDQEINERFIYRDMTYCEKFFSKHVNICSWPHLTNNPIRRSFKIPVDFFAIREKRSVGGQPEWIFFIGLDGGSAKNSDVQLSFAPVLDLKAMAHHKAGDENNGAADQIKEMLQEIFINTNENNTTTHIKMVPA